MYFYPERFACIKRKSTYLVNSLRPIGCLHCQGVYCEEKREGIPSKLKRTDTLQLCVCWDLNIRVQWREESGRGRYFPRIDVISHSPLGRWAGYSFGGQRMDEADSARQPSRVAEVLSWKFRRKTSTALVWRTEVWLLQPPSPFDLFHLSSGQINS